ncbi:hypothetical protein AB5I41_15085 [Sphingomonas sp. MMS24-JH45]
MLNIVSILIGLVALVLGIVPFLPFLAWGYWFVIPIAVVGAAVGALSSRNRGGADEPHPHLDLRAAADAGRRLI